MHLNDESLDPVSMKVLWVPGFDDNKDRRFLLPKFVKLAEVSNEQLVLELRCS